MSQNAAGKLLIDKICEAERSPNLADAVVISFAPRQMPVKISPDVLALVSKPIRGQPLGVR